MAIYLLIYLNLNYIEQRKSLSYLYNNLNWGILIILAWKLRHKYNTIEEISAISHQIYNNNLMYM